MKTLSFKRNKNSDEELILDYTLFFYEEPVKLGSNSMLLFFRPFQPQNFLSFVLKIMCSLMAPNVVIPYRTVLHCRDPDLEGA